MRATLALFLATGCNFLTADLEDQAPVRPIDTPGAATEFGRAMAALPAGSCGASAALVVAGYSPSDGPQLHLVTFGSEGGSTRSAINNRQSALVAAERIVAMDPADDGTTSLLIETDQRKVRVLIDNDCDGMDDTVCGDFCDEGEIDASTPITTASEDRIDLGSGEVTVTGDPADRAVTAGSQDVVIPEDIDAAGLGRAVAKVPFKGSTGDVTEELAVGADLAAFLFFRTGIEGDCDPRDGAPAEVACPN